ncbi:hypothetical protein FRB90_002028 [Tulasnella sp. 427]|nr:hypothetical protein FRB90_002028 [Tulasnella sp. 427]
MSDDLRELIVSTALSKRNEGGGGPEDYAGHVKIYEQDDGGSKSRFIILSFNRSGQGFIHKSKQNPSGSFSIGKTWRLDDLRGLEVVDQRSFKISFNRAYIWITESSRDQSNFLTAAVQLYRQLKGSTAGLTLVGVQEAPTASLAPAYVPQRAQTPTGQSTSSAAAASVSPRRPTQFRAQEDLSTSPGRAGSPSGSNSRDARVYGGLAPIAGTPSSSRSARTDLGRVPSRSNTADYESRAPVSRPRVGELGSRSARTDSGDRERVPSRSRPAADRQASNEYARPSLERERERDADTPRVERGVRPQESEQRPRERDRDRDRRVVEEPRVPTPTGYDQPSSFDDRGRETLQDRLRNGLQSRSASSATTVTPASAPTQSRLRPPSPPPPAATASDQSVSTPKRDPNARISFFDPANQAAADRLLFGASEGIGAFGEEDPAEATMANVEEMLEGIEWGFSGGYGAGRSGRTGAADMIEARLLDELMALEKANIHSFLESDDRVAVVLKYIDDAIKELDEMDGYISAYKVQLNVRILGVCFS